jgi:hypothetical protein
LANWKNVCETGDSHLMTLSKPRSRPWLWQCHQMEIASLRDVFSAKHAEVQGSCVGAVRWVGLVPEMSLGAGCLLLLPGLGK